LGRVLLVTTALAVCAPATAQQSQHRTGLLDLTLGTAAGALPEEAFIDYACGTNGGPPGKPIGSFRDFAGCAPESSGLHEVTFRYDDELEYRLLARGDAGGAEINGGTAISGYAIYASALFDDAGTLRGLRAVTDDRETLRNRTNSYVMADYLQNYFGREGFACTDHEPVKGEGPLGNTYVNQTCSKTANGMTISTEAHLFRKAGQTVVNAHTQQVNRGQFESSARLEIIAAGDSPEAAPAPVAEAVTYSGGDCIKCDLRHADLRGLKLDGADLTGADFYAADLSGTSCVRCKLDGARFKRAMLAKADFTDASIVEGTFHAAKMGNVVLDGADLSRANLNRTDLGFAHLAKARLNGAMLYDADLRSGDLTGADLSQAMAGTAKMPRAKLDGATIVGTDMRDTTLRGASFAGARLDASAFDHADMRDIIAAGVTMVGARLPWVDIRGATLTGANLDQAAFYSADLREADLSGATLTNGDLYRARTAGAILDSTKLAGTKMPNGAIHD
jgi:uncharacterized protein YjbI with pentapeptide repeats